MSEPFYYGPWDIEKIQNDIDELKASGSGSGLPEYFPPMMYDFHLYGKDGDEWEEITELADSDTTYPIRGALVTGAMTGITKIVITDYTDIKIEFSNTNAYTVGENNDIIAISSPVIVENLTEYVIVLCDTSLVGVSQEDVIAYNISEYVFLKQNNIPSD